jgi:O-antigen ligase
MSTAIGLDPRLLAEREYVRPAATTSVWALAETWLATIPLLFLVARGTFSFENTDSNVSGTGSLITASAPSGGAARHFAELILFYGIMCILCLPRYKSVLASFRENFLIAALPFFAILSTAWSAVPSRSLSFGVMALINTAFAFYLAKRYTRNQQLELFLGLGVMALLSSILIVAVYPAAGFDHKENTAHSVEGLFGHKNHCAMIMILLLIPAFYMKPSNGTQKVLRALYVIFTMGLIVSTMARTGWILLLLTVCFVPFIGLLRRLRQKDRFVVGFIVTALVAGIALLALTEASNIAIALGKDPTFSGRTEIWKAVMRPIFKRPFRGYGYYAFWTQANPEALATAMSLGSTGLGNAENGILQMGLEMGGFGLGILFVALIHMCRMCLVCFRRERTDFTLWCICMVFLGILYGGVVGDKFMHPHTIEWTILVLVYANLHSMVKEWKPRRLPQAGPALEDNSYPRIAAIER